jgi:hypothetical protein
MLPKFVRRAGVLAIAAVAMLGLAGCSFLSNGYGGWYWQAASISDTSANANPSNTNNNNNAKAMSSQSSQTHG